jgi:hypothetical protein
MCGKCGKNPMKNAWESRGKSEDWLKMDIWMILRRRISEDLLGLASSECVCDADYVFDKQLVTLCGDKNLFLEENHEQIDSM